MKKAVQKRPTETVSGAALAGILFAFLTQAGVPPVFAAIGAAIAGFGPAVVSGFVDSIGG